jgi:hypothetical protein
MLAVAFRHGRRIEGEPGTGWRTATRAQKDAWSLRVAAKCGYRDRAAGCGRFKPRPSTPCGFCGNEPVRHGQDPWEYDREHGWDTC